MEYFNMLYICVYMLYIYVGYMLSAMKIGELQLNSIKRYRNHINNKEFLVLITRAYNIGNLIPRVVEVNRSHDMPSLRTVENDNINICNISYFRNKFQENIINY